MDIITYALSKKIAAHALSGVQSMSVSGQTLTINTKDSGVLTMTFPTPKDGVSVTDIDVNANNQIVFTMSDGTEFISGKIPTVKGDKGEPFKYSDFTQEQLEALKGADGFSPSAKVEKVGDTATITITDKDGTTTATIKDGQGGSGETGEENTIDSISINGVNVVPDENKNVDITVPNIYVGDTEPIDDNMEVWFNPNGESSSIDVPIEKIKVNGELQIPVNKVVDITVPSIDGLAKTEDIPTKVSELTNDSGYLTEHQDISGKVDKVEGKSLISDTEIARLATVNNYDDTDIKAEIAKKADTTAIPNKVSELTNDSNYQTAEQVNSTVITEIAKVVADAPEDFDTLKEMSDWISSHESDASTMNSAIQTNKSDIATLQTDKVDKVKGKSLIADTEIERLKSVKNYDDTEIKAELAKKANSTDVTKEISDKIAKVVADAPESFNTLKEISDWISGHENDASAMDSAIKDNKNAITTLQTDKADKTEIPTELPADGGNSATVNGHTVNSDVPANAKFTDTTYGIATTSTNGLMSKDMVSKLNGIAEGANKTTVDTALSSTSTNPVQNKVVKAYVDKKTSENVDFSTSTSKTLNGTVEAQLVLSKATRNLLNPALATTTFPNGVTCTNNGDGTYTLNGTSTKDKWISFADVTLNPGKYKFIATEHSVYVSNLCVSLNSTTIARPGDKFTIQSKSVCNIGLSTFNITFNNVLIKPMITTDLSATYDDFVPYSGYEIKTCGKNLLKSAFDTDINNGITFTRNDDGTYSLSGSRTDTSIGAYITFIDNLPLEKGRYKLTGAVDENNYIRCIIKGSSSGNRNIYDYGDGVVLDVNETDTTITLLIVSADDTSQTRIIKPMLTTDLSVTYDDFEPYKDGGTVQITPSTEFPLLGLKSFDGETNIISPGNVEVTYVKSDSGKAILDTSGNKLDKDNVVNNQTTTDEGYALDARQANPNVEGSLGSQIKAVTKNTTVNLLNPTLETTTQNGITCTNNGDGTYTLNGTNTVSGIIYIGIASVTLPNQKAVILGSNNPKVGVYIRGETPTAWGDKSIEILESQYCKTVDFGITVESKATLNNALIKPMINKDLNATYDDFVPYTGDTGRLNGDVAELRAQQNTMVDTVTGLSCVLSLEDGIICVREA